MSPLEKIIEDIEHLGTPTSRFVEFLLKNEEYKRANTDKAKWKEIHIISQQYKNVFNDGGYDELRKIYKDRYPHL
ncbi:hypothetical protein IWX83_003353 [Flavobacterium sp. CG_9.1]|uniref:hypothetical protein n=1 Tax=Flavobacterium sp. CG_9.1 TaxID=2787728 RepID=UPI0018C9213D|nr:hypothetical protein [Flavobacterium sp. CG_9.1]MBG6063543.1 hypothetical protein [Flavobacterium sp. CG_9.1]